MENDKIDEIIKEGKTLLELLPDPEITLQRGFKTGVYAGRISKNEPGELVGYPHEPLIVLAECELEKFHPKKHYIQIHGERGKALVERDIDEFFLEEMGERNADFFAGAPALIRKLLAALLELKEEEEVSTARHNEDVDFDLFNEIANEIFSAKGWERDVIKIELYKDTKEVEFTIIVVDEREPPFVDFFFLFQEKVGTKGYRIAYVRPEEHEKIKSGEILLPVWMGQKPLRTLVRGKIVSVIKT